MRSREKILRFIESPELPGIMTFILFLVSGYATYMVFTSGLEGVEWGIGVLKTIGLEGCKILFYVEYSKTKIKKNLYFWLWLFFTVVSLLHTMNYEVGIINRNTNKKMETASGQLESKKTLEQLRIDKTDIKNDKKILLDEKKEVLNEFKTEKKDINKNSNNNIKNTDTSLQNNINSYSNKYATRKRQAINEKNSKLDNLVSNKANLLNKIDSKRKKESSLIQNNITKKDDQLKELDKKISIAEDKLQSNTKEIKDTKGLLPLIILLLGIGKMPGLTIITLIIVTAVAFCLDLAGCKSYQMFCEKASKVVDNLQNEDEIEINDNDLVTEKNLNEIPEEVNSTSKIEKVQAKKEFNSKANLIKYLKFAFEGRKQGLGYKNKNLIEKTKMSATELKKLRDTLETLGILKQKEVQKFGRNINITEMTMSFQEAINIIYKKL